MSQRTGVPTRRRQWLTLAVVAIGVFITSLDNSIVNVALPSIQADLGLGLGGVAWVVNGYILSFAVLLLAAGRLADTLGRRRLFLIGVTAFTGASRWPDWPLTPGRSSAPACCRASGRP